MFWLQRLSKMTWSIKKKRAPRLSNSCTVTNPFHVFNSILKNAESQIKNTSGSHRNMASFSTIPLV